MMPTVIAVTKQKANVVPHWCAICIGAGPRFANPLGVGAKAARPGEGAPTGNLRPYMGIIDGWSNNERQTRIMR